jgi:hypothetical protein
MANNYAICWRHFETRMKILRISRVMQTGPEVYRLGLKKQRQKNATATPHSQSQRSASSKWLLSVTPELRGKPASIIK